MKLKLYDDPISGNGYKVRLLLAQLGIPYVYEAVDILKRETRSVAFLSKNPNGRIPLLELDDGSHLAESNAIQFYLAAGTPMLPEGALERAQVLQWMFFEQYSHEPYLAVLRFWHHAGEAEKRAAEIPEKLERGYQALQVMENHLGDRLFFVGKTYSIADIALFAYPHVCDEGGFDLDRFPAVRSWLERVARQPGHIGMAHRLEQG
jgi:glutathione S-transferase